MSIDPNPRERRRLARFFIGQRGLVMLSLSLPFVALAVLLAFAPSKAAAPAPSRDVIANSVVGLISLDLAIAVFAVNFSFLAFQLSPYRSLAKGVSARHLTLSLVVILMALTPLLGFRWGERVAARTAITLMPILAYVGLLLVALALREAEPMALLARRLRRRSLNRFLARFATSVRQQLRQRRDLDQPQPEVKIPPPTHEIFFHPPPPPLLDDPIEFLVHTATVAIANSDTYAYAVVLERALGLAAEWEEHTEPDDDVPGYEVKAALDGHALGALQRIGRAGAEKAAPIEFAARFVTTCAEFIQRRTTERRQTKELSLRVLHLAANVGGELIVHTSTEVVIGLLIASRHAVERGIVEVETDLAEFELAAYPIAIQSLGKEAIKARDPEFLYRCLDALCWTACTAVRRDGSEVGRTCIQVLVQLGREARAANLHCFWTRCTLTPADHVDERLGWIATWVPQAQPKGRERWLRSLGTAYSRLHGVRYNLSLGETDGSPRILVERSDVPHLEQVDDNGRIGTVDYSDFTVLKDYNLY